MKAYSVLAYDRTQTAYATKGEAMKAAREALAQEDVDVVRVEEIELMPITKALIVRLINYDGGYVANARHVATLSAKNAKSKEML